MLRGRGREDPAYADAPDEPSDNDRQSNAVIDESLAMSVFMYTTRDSSHFDTDVGDRFTLLDDSSENWKLERTYRSLHGRRDVRRGYVPKGCLLKLEGMFCFM